MAVGRDITERLQIIAQGFEESGRTFAAATCDEAVAEILRLRHGGSRRGRRRSAADTRGLAHDLADAFGLTGLFQEQGRKKRRTEPMETGLLTERLRPAVQWGRTDPRFDA